MKLLRQYHEDFQRGIVTSSQFFTNQVKDYKTVVLCILCKYLLGGRVTLGEQAFGQILTLSDHPSYPSVGIDLVPFLF